MSEIYWYFSNIDLEDHGVYVAVRWHESFRRGASLLDGQLDEEAEANAFKEAVAAWRNAGNLIPRKVERRNRWSPTGPM